MNQHIFTMIMLCANILCFNAFAQNKPSDTKSWRIGIQAGMNAGNADYRFTPQNVEYSHSTDVIAGVRAGLTGDFRLWRSLRLNTGLLYSGKGFKLNKSIEDDNQYVEEKWLISYLEIPANLSYMWHLHALKVFIEAGPCLDVRVNAKAKEPDGGSTDLKVNGNDVIKRTDLGISAGTGIEAGKLRFALNYGLGLINIADYRANKEKIYNRTWGIAISYFCLSSGN